MNKYLVVFSLLVVQILARRHILHGPSHANSIETSTPGFNHLSDKTIPWENFKSAMMTLEEHKSEFPRAARVLIEEMRTSMRKVREHYLETTERMYNWCGATNERLNTYVTGSVQDTDQVQRKKSRATEKLTERVDAKYLAVKEHIKSLTRLSDILNKLYTLRTRLYHDHDKIERANHAMLRDKIESAIQTTNDAVRVLTKDVKTIMDMNKYTILGLEKMINSHLNLKEYEPIAKMLTDECHHYRTMHGAQ